jgi:sugar phosphate isomerase/epimerase
MPDMKMAFSTNAFVRHPLAQAVRTIGSIGYPGVEILADKPHFFPPTARAQDLEDLQNALRHSGLVVSNVNANTATGYYADAPPESFFEPALSNADAKLRRWRIEYSKACIDLAREIHAPNVSVSSGRPLPQCPPDRGRALFKEALAELVEYAGAADVHIGIEYEPGLLVQTAHDTLDVLRGVNSPFLGVNLDLGHAYVAGEDLEWVIQELAGVILNIHLEDIKGRDHYHLIPGLGDIDFQKVFDALTKIGYNRFVTVELYTYPDNPEYAAQMSYEYLSPFFRGVVHAPLEHHSG